MILSKFRKQPDEVKDYDIDYGPWLDPINDTLDTVEFVVECLDDEDDFSLVVFNHQITPTTAKLWLQGGTDGLVYKVTVKAFTPAGRIDESELIFAVDNI